MSEVRDHHSEAALKETVHAAYEILLRRLPESDDVVSLHAREGSPAAIFRRIAASSEAQGKYPGGAGQPGNPLFNFSAMFDVEAIIRRFARDDLRPVAGHVVNFQGVLVEPRYFPPLLADKAGQVEPLPLPGNWHADMAEWGAVLRAVELATDEFRIIELGCGWGCWLNNAGTAARSRGLRPFLIGVEGDPGHIQFARDCCANNAFEAARLELHHGIAAAEPGVALFPLQETAGGSWGLEPVFSATPAQREAYLATGKYEQLPMVALRDLAAAHERIELLHIDIQGGEADLIEQSLALLNEKVAYIFVGTHSRVIEGRICAALFAAGWQLEVERPAIVQLTENGPVTHIDGAYGWRNLALT